MLHSTSTKQGKGCVHCDVPGGDFEGEPDIPKIVKSPSEKHKNGHNVWYRSGQILLKV
jgi:hypothetical protein